MARKSPKSAMSGRMKNDEAGEGTMHKTLGVKMKHGMKEEAAEKKGAKKAGMAYGSKC